MQDGDARGDGDTRGVKPTSRSGTCPSLPAISVANARMVAPDKTRQLPGLGDSGELGGSGR